MPSSSERVAVTVAGTPSVYRIVVASATPSPLGLTLAGWAATADSVSAVPPPAVIEPVAGRRVGPARIGHADGPRDRGGQPAREANPAGRWCGHGPVELRQARERDRAREQVQLAVDDRSWAAREADVPVARDRPEEHGDPGRKARIAARGHEEQRQRVDVGDVEPPGEEAHQRAPGLGGEGGQVVVA